MENKIFFFIFYIISCVNNLLSSNDNIIIRSKIIDIEQSKCAFNPSFVQDVNGYFMVYREVRKKLPNEYGLFNAITKIKYVHLDLNFKPISKPKPLQLPYQNVEDPRIFNIKEKLYITYTVLLCKNQSCSPLKTQIGISQINTQGEVLETTLLQYKKTAIEKNWTSFSTDDNTTNTQELYFIYSHNPLVIIKQITNDTMTTIIEKKVKSEILKQHWENKWGQIRGGTPAILIDGNYLEFFHSSFKENRIIKYVMGAILFESKYPFSILKISNNPIIDNNFYTTTTSGCLTCHNCKVIFPSGIVYTKEQDRDVFHVACGENDRGIRIVTIDKENLLKNMIPVQDYLI